MNLWNKLSIPGIKSASMDNQIKDEYSFLPDKEIETFFMANPKLLKEKDIAVVENHLEEYYKDLAIKYTTLYNSVKTQRKERIEAFMEQASQNGSYQSTNQQNGNIHSQENNKAPSQTNTTNTQQNVSTQEDIAAQERATFLSLQHQKRLEEKNNPSTSNRGGYIPPSNNSQNTQGNSSQSGARIEESKGNSQISSTTKAEQDNQILEYRKMMQEKFKQNPKGPEPQKNNTQNSSSTSDKRMMTGKEIEDMRIKEDQIKFGKRALELSNQFRAEHGMHAMVWSQHLYDVAMEHSKDMAEGRVPFSHDGFDKRANKFNLGMGGFAENVAMNSNSHDPAKTAVDSWINSPGHRRNLLSSAKLCVIACYRSQGGEWYFTQLFAM